MLKGVDSVEPPGESFAVMPGNHGVAASLPIGYAGVRDDLMRAIDAAHEQAICQANLLRNVAYWLIGDALVKLQPENHGARYGARVLDQMSRDLTTRYPGAKGYSPTNLKYARMLAGVVPALKIGPRPGTDLVPEPVMRLSWGHIKLLLDKFRQDREVFTWYAARTLSEGWSRAVLAAQITSNVHEREGRALTNVRVVEPDHASDLVRQMGKDPMVFDWLPLAQSYRERHLEDALITQLARLMTELGRGFLWAGRQRRLVLVDDETAEEKEFLVDLLFYHKPTRRWFVIDLKVTDFEYAHAMQVGLYTRIIDQQLRDRHDEPTVGMVLCPSRHKELAKMALSALSTPTFVTTYTLAGGEVAREALPAGVQDVLPADAEIADALAKAEDHTDS
jgi:predicted nuclease of restriction endonuclease-like (RecB) superfamily